MVILYYWCELYNLTLNSNQVSLHVLQLQVALVLNMTPDRNLTKVIKGT